MDWSLKSQGLDPISWIAFQKQRRPSKRNLEFNKSGTKTVEDSLEFPWDLHLLEGQSVLEL